MRLYLLDIILATAQTLLWVLGQQTGEQIFRLICDTAWELNLLDQNQCKEHIMITIVKRKTTTDLQKKGLLISNETCCG